MLGKCLGVEQPARQHGGVAGRVARLEARYREAGVDGGRLRRVGDPDAPVAQGERGADGAEAEQVPGADGDGGVLGADQVAAGRRDVDGRWLRILSGS